MKNDAMKLVEAIEQGLEDDQETSNRRHLGGSEIGHWCERHLFYKFRWAVEVKHEGRMLRLFTRGHYEEPRFIELLKRLGMQIVCEDPKTLKQFTIEDHNGHFGGSLDTLIRKMYDDPNQKRIYLGEFKTYAEKYFKPLIKNGVQKEKPDHYAQMQIYMHKRKLTKALYCAINKNNDELYFEFVDLNVKVAEDLIEKAGRIIFTDKTPIRGSDDSTWYRCGPKWCEHRDICHKMSVPALNCRTCAFSEPLTDFKHHEAWRCNHNEKLITTNHQRQGCLDHIFLPTFIPAKQISASKGEHYISYELKDGSILKNGRNHTTSEELQLKKLI